MDHTKGTNVDGYFVAQDGHVDIVFENVGSQTCTNYSKFKDDKNKSFRNAADALLERFYNTSGSFKIAMQYKVIIVIVFGPEVTIYTTNIKDKNCYTVSKVFQEKYHFCKNAYLAKVLIHLRFCLAIKTLMERNVYISVEYGNSMESTSKEEQTHYFLLLHTTPTKHY